MHIDERKRIAFELLLQLFPFKSYYEKIKLFDVVDLTLGFKQYLHLSV